MREIRLSFPPTRAGLLAVSIGLLAAFGCQDAQDVTAPDEAAFSVAPSSSELIVLLDRGQAPGPSAANRGRAAQIAGELGVTPTHTYGTAVFGFSGTVPAGRVQALQRDPRVVHVEPVEVWEIDVVARSNGQTLPTGVDRVEADRNPEVSTDGSGVAVDLDVAILDSGIDPSHEDLNVAGGRNFHGGNPNNWSDGSGHGTHVAGTVAAIDNAVGVVGVAPGTPVWAVKVCSNGGLCFTGNIVAGIDWVAERKASGAIDFAAANFSISSADSLNDCEEPANAVHAAICGVVDEGVVFVMSGGNDNREKHAFPVGFSVSAIADFDGKAGGAGAPTCRNDEDDTLAGFSNHGEHVDIAAPGICIVSTVPGGYGTLSGTSMAAPHVTGAVALYLHANGLSPASDRAGADAIRDAIVSAALPRGTENHECSYDDVRIGGPLLFANAAAFGGDGTCTVATTEAEPDPETGTLSGEVTDVDTEEAIEGAQVAVAGTHLSATTDRDGSYTVEGVPQGTHDVTASADGYESSTQEATVTADASTTVDFALVPEAEPTDPVDAEPVIEVFEVSTRATGPWNRVDVEWTVSHADGALESVTTELLDENGGVLDSETTAVSGGSASGEHDLRTRSGTVQGVRLTVTDTAGNSASDEKPVAF